MNKNIIIEESEIKQLIKDAVAEGIQLANLNFMELPELLGVTDMARYMGVKRCTVTAWYRKGLLKATQPSKRGSIYITREDAIEFKKNYKNL